MILLLFHHFPYFFRHFLPPNLTWLFTNLFYKIQPNFPTKKTVPDPNRIETPFYLIKTVRLYYFLFARLTIQGLFKGVDIAVDISPRNFEVLWVCVFYWRITKNKGLTNKVTSNLRLFTTNIVIFLVSLVFWVSLPKEYYI